MIARLQMQSLCRFVEAEQTQSGLDRLKALRATSLEFKGRHIKGTFRADPENYYIYVIYAKHPYKETPPECIFDKALLPTMMGLDPYFDIYIERTLKEDV